MIHYGNNLQLHLKFKEDIVTHSFPEHNSSLDNLLKGPGCIPTDHDVVQTRTDAKIFIGQRREEQ